MAMKIAIIGAGPGGYAAALRAAQLGAEVTVIEKEVIGGTCLNRGCIPSKIMKQTADMLESFKKATDFGITSSGGFSVDMHRVMNRKKEIISILSKGMMTRLDTHKIRFLSGNGSVKALNLAEVTDATGKSVEAPWDALILAPGSEPLGIPAFPFDGSRIISSNDALTLKRLPSSMLIIGGGVIGCEFAAIFSALGVKITMVEAMSRLLPLPSIDEECSKILHREMKKRKIEVHLNSTVKKIYEKGGSLQAALEPSPLSTENQPDKAPAKTVDVETVLVCIGRKPEFKAIGLEKIGVKIDSRGWIIADKALRTNAPAVYAIGDCLGPERMMLAHMASNEGAIAAENIFGKPFAVSYAVVPNVIFTQPEIACVGMTETQAANQGYRVKSASVLFRALGKAHVIGQIEGQVKIVSDGESGKVLGVHIVGPHATDLIAEAALAIQAGCKVSELADTIHGHPTLAEIMMETAFKVLGR